MAGNPATTAKPEIIAVSDLLEGVSSGEIRIPRFQRPFIWGPDDMLQLFDSVLRGYPIGSLLIWQTDREDITSLDAVGPISLPSKGPRTRQYVVDGHQRLATLFGVLTLPEGHPRNRQEDWRWWIAYDLRAEQFIHIKSGEEPIPYHLLPLRSVLRTVDFARRTREMITSNKLGEREVELLLDRADNVQRTIREYRVPMTIMRSGSLDDAVTIFARVNQRGRDMTPDQMVSALTFRDRQEGDFDLAEEIDKILGILREYGFADLHRRIILQVILALANLDFTRPSYEKIVDRSSHDQMRPAVNDASNALLSCVNFLTKNVGLRTSRLLPYSSIIVMLAMFFDSSRRRPPESFRDQSKILEKWFWAMSFNGWFAGANTTDLRKAGDAMRALAAHGSDFHPDFERFFFDRPIRQFPETFDRRSARVRASLLVQILVGKPREPRGSQEFDSALVFSDSASNDLPYFFPNRRRPHVSNPANRVILPDGYPRSARQTFLSLNLNSDDDIGVMRSHFIDQETFHALKLDDFERFIALREEAIFAAEKEFLASYSLTIDVSAQRSNEEIDSDE